MDLSVIIPCYNSGKYLPDAIESIRKSTNITMYRYEIIIVNDGSTDGDTLALLNELNNADCVVFHQENKGPAAARNKAISHARGKYLLFLDSDNKVCDHFIETGISRLENTDADLVYGRAFFFGDSSDQRFTTGPFDINKIIAQNYIDVCCIVRKDVCTGIGGFDEEKKLIGFEDWDFHIRVYAAGYKFCFLDKEVYWYRNIRNSLSQQHTEEGMKNAYAYVHAKHSRFVSDVLCWYQAEYKAYLFDKDRPFRSCIKYLYKKYSGRRQKRQHAS